MSDELPLFPLGTVLFPGLVLPLRVFEERYRALVRHIRDLPDGTPREFGVVAIKRGWETAAGPAIGSAGGRPRSGSPGGPAPSAPPFTMPPGGPAAPVEPPRGVAPPAGTARGSPSGDRPVEGGPARAEQPSLYEIGCTAQVRQITEHPDGRFDLVAVGGRRFAVESVDPEAAPYLVARVRWLHDEDEDHGELGGEADDLAGVVLGLFQRYLRLIRPRQPGEQLPDDPTVLSHLIAATTALPLPERQTLLAAPGTASRLRRERTLLRREVAFLTRVRAVPVPLPELAVATSPN